MKALTIWQPWASLIVNGWKPYEYRRWPAPAHVVGQRIVIHASKHPLRTLSLADVVDSWTKEGFDVTGRPVDRRDLEHGAAFLRQVWACTLALPFGAGLGTAVLGAPRRVTDLFAATVADRAELDPDVWVWPLTDIEPFATPIPMRGAQGFWNWPEAGI